MKTQAEFAGCSTKLKALAQSTRLRIVKELMTSRRNVTELCDLVGDSMVNVSHHLGVLRQAELVAWAVEGREIYYWLNHPVSADASSIDLGCCRFNLDD